MLRHRNTKRLVKRPKRSIIFSTQLAVMLTPLLAKAGEDATTHITESGNIATGFAITLWMGMVDSLGTHCGALPGDVGMRNTRKMARQERAGDERGAGIHA